MKVEDITKGASITVVATFEDKKIVFDSQVKTVNGNVLLIPPIKYNNKTVGFNDKFLIDLHYVDQGKLYRFPDVKVTLARYGQLLFHKITIEHDGSIYNRRGDYRLYIGKEMSLFYNASYGMSKIRVTLKDISVSGFAFVSSEKIESNQTVRLKYIDERFSIDLPAKVLRADWNEHLNSYVYGCKIIQSFPALGQYLIEKQREILKRTRAATSQHS